MNRTLAAAIITTFLAGGGLGLSQCRAEAPTTASAVQAKKPWADPKRFEKDIAAFEAETTAPKGAIVAYGSSSIRGWHKTIQEDLQPLPIVRRGFGGSNMNDAVYFMDRVVIPLQPRAVLLYEGDNDVSGGQPVEEIVGKYREFLSRLHTALPETRTYILSVKPSVSRWKHWPTMQKVNAELKKIAEADPLVTFIDVATPMLNADGTPRPEIYLGDKLHMKREGYEIWRDAVRPVLLEKEGAAGAR